MQGARVGKAFAPFLLQQPMTIWQWSSRGADVNDDDSWGGNALVKASLFGQVDTVKLLIEHGADPNMEDDGVTALDYASHQLIAPETKAPPQNYRTIVALLQANGGQASLLKPSIG